MNHRLISIVVICVLILMATPVVVTAADFDVTTEESINVADRSVEQGGNTYEINSITQVDPTDQITADVDAPSDTDVTMYLYDKNENILRGYEGTGTTNFNVDIDDHGASEPGTYALVVQSDGIREAVHPLIVRGYSISANAPGSATMGNDISVDGEFTQLRGDQYDQIDIVIAATDTETEVISQSNIDGETFSTSISTQNTELEPGSYDVYAVVRGSDTALGRQEILGLSSPQLLEIEADESEDSNDDDGNDDIDDGGGGGGGGTAPVDSTEEESEETTEDTPKQASLDDGAVSRTITDNNPEQDGMNVPVNAGPVGEVTFESSESDTGGEVTVSKSSTTTETFSSQFGSNRVKTAVSVTVPDSLASTTATVEFRLSEEELGETAPTDLQAVKNTDGGTQVLSSTTEAPSDGGAVVTARTPGFSEFAVITAPAESDSTTTQNDTTNGNTDETDSTTETESSDTTQSDSTDDGAPGFGLVVAFVALVVTALAGIRQ